MLAKAILISLWEVRKEEKEKMQKISSGPLRLVSQNCYTPDDADVLTLTTEN